ncbi:MAG TPA: nucleoside triphosphate pyrophosphohydrolase [Desulfosarcina sp.]|nr:nucleoside triphosphate pyrophosphohydrolase [Desulfosarcina sp.]
MEEDAITPSTDSLAAVTGLIRRLRGENGCPWDRKQNPQSLSVYLIEEMYELVDAVAAGNPQAVCEELGDVLFQVLFLAELFAEAGAFDLNAVVERNVEKMIRRHPHVFGDQQAISTEAVRRNWHAIKRAEQREKNRDHDSLLSSIPASLPALMRSYRVSERAARTGFDWNTLAEVMDKVEEEWREFKSAARQVEDAADLEKAAVEFGDIVFTLANVARFMGFHPETALTAAIQKFEQRFRHMEKAFREQGGDIESASRDAMDAAWETAKQKTYASG